MSDLAVTGVYSHINRGRYADCNASHEFYFDQNITETFHESFAKNNSCVLPFWYGTKLAKSNKWNLCKGNQSFLYNDTETNRAFSKTVDSMSILPCNRSKVSFGPVHTTGLSFTSALSLLSFEVSHLSVNL